MKFTLLEPCDYNFYHSQVSGPLGLAYVASYLDQELDNSVETSIETDVDYVIKTKPDFVGISAYTQNFNKAINAAKKIKKELNIPVIVGGKHITALPETLPDCFDLGVVGDGERTMSDIMKLFIDKKGLLPEELINIQGVAFKDEGKIHITKQRDPLKDLDFLPKPKRDILHAYWPSLNKRWFWQQGIYTSRGCPYKCPFCIHSKLQFVSRYHSPTRVVTEIEEIISKFPDQKIIAIYDDLFIISKKRLKEIRDIIVSEKIHKKVSFTAMCKSNHFDEDIAIMLREMNVRHISFGFESGDEKTLQYLKKDSSKVKENLDSVNYCNKHGIESGGYFIVGSEPETKEAMAKTYWFMSSNRPPMLYMGAFCLTPFPGTKEWDNAYEKGFVDPEKEDWDDYNYTDYKINSRVFVNEKYDFSFFRTAYKDWFMPLVAKCTNIKHYPEEKRVLYEVIMKHLEDLNISNDNSILEIGTKFNSTFSELFPENENIELFDHWIYREKKENIEVKLNELNNKKFDYIVFNYSLEQMTDPYNQIDSFMLNNLNEKGKVIILTKNPQFIANIFNFLSKPWANITDGYKGFDNYHILNIKELKEKLSKKMNLLLVQKNIKEDVSIYEDFYNKVVPLLSSKLDIKEFLSTSDISNFIFIAGKK